MVLRVALNVGSRQFSSCSNSTPDEPNSMHKCNVGIASLQGLNRFDRVLAVCSKEELPRLNPK